MRFATLDINGRAQGVIWDGGRWVRLDAIEPRASGDLLALIHLEPGYEELSALEVQAKSVEGGVSAGAARFMAPFRHPRLIWGIGLNYADHAADLSACQPDDPASFIKGDHTIIGHGEAILLPSQSSRVTTEAEIALVIGRRTSPRDGPAGPDAVFGLSAVLDQTAEDILQQNPRFLTRAKNFATFFAFGPELLTLDELPAPLEDVVVSTVVNGGEVRQNSVSNMMHSPQQLLAYHSLHMPLFPGDIISTGTPGAIVVQDGDEAEARITGFEVLRVRVESAMG